MARGMLGERPACLPDADQRRREMSKPQRLRKVGRPPKLTPEPIPDTPGNVARVLTTSQPRQPDNWEYLKQRPVSDSASADE